MALKERFIMDGKAGTGGFSLKAYLVRGALFLIIVGGGYYFYFGKMRSGLEGLEQEKADAILTEPPEYGWVNGILYSQEKPSAVIDKDIVYEGQVVSGIRESRAEVVPEG
jgi:hypothetical protein